MPPAAPAVVRVAAFLEAGRVRYTVDSFAKNSCAWRERTRMPEERKRSLSLDWWAVIAALGAAMLVRLGLVPRIPW